MAQDSLIELTAEIVSSHVANNAVAVGDVGNLVQRVYDALAGLGAPPAPEPTVKTPAVPVRSSVKPDYIVCLECGRKQKTLKRHLATAHNMTAKEYRAEYGLRDDYPMTAPNYSEQRRSMAHSIGLGRKAKPGEEAPAPQTRRTREAMPNKGGEGETTKASSAPKGRGRQKAPAKSGRKESPTTEAASDSENA
jgi:predicted transcriptional regulator